MLTAQWLSLPLSTDETNRAKVQKTRFASTFGKPLIALCMITIAGFGAKFLRLRKTLF